MDIYIGGISFSATEETIKDLFAPHGTVERVTLVHDRFSGKLRGFAFVVMQDNEEARKAIAAIDGRIVDGRVLRVSRAFGSRVFAPQC